jgi:hypothetical protein
MHFVVALDVRRALCCVRVREELVQLSEPPVLSLVGRRGVLCSAGRMQNCQPLSPMHDDCSLDARARSADLSRDPSDGGRASFQISVSAAAFFPIGSTPSAYTHIYSLPVSVCVFASVWHFPDRMSRIFARYVRVSCVVTHCTLYQHAHKGVVAQRNYCLLMS